LSGISYNLVKPFGLGKILIAMILITLRKKKRPVLLVDKNSALRNIVINYYFLYYEKAELYTGLIPLAFFLLLME